jgi:GAF domain-containing protein
MALAWTLSEIAHMLQEEEGLEATLAAIARAAVDTVPGAEDAGITTVTDRRAVITAAATSQLVLDVDRAQYATGQGPCLDALYDQDVVRFPDVSSDTRWPAFSEAVGRLPVASMLAFQLYVAGEDLGALNLYSSAPRAFDDQSESVGFLFARHASVAFAEARNAHHLARALDVRDMIGQAKGILVERHKTTSDRAFRLLVAVSQRRNVKLADVARHLVDTGELLPARVTGTTGGPSR